MCDTSRSGDREDPYLPTSLMRREEFTKRSQQAGEEGRKLALSHPSVCAQVSATAGCCCRENDIRAEGLVVYHVRRSPSSAVWKHKLERNPREFLKNA